MQDIKNRELKDRRSNTNTKKNVLRFELLLYVLTFTQKDFHYVHQRPSTKGLSLRNYNLQIGSTQLQLSHTSIKEGGTKPNTKQRETDNLVIIKIPNNTW